MKCTWHAWPLAIAFWLFLHAPAHAADPLVRGEGFYLAWWKLLLFWLVFLLGVWIAGWIDRDCKEVGERYGVDGQLWNTIFVFVFLGVFLIGTFAIPIFAAGLPIALLGLIVPVIIFVVQRNQAVMETDRVLTPKHIAFVLSNLGKGKKGKGKKPPAQKLPYEEGAPVHFVALGGKDEQENQANLIFARQSVPHYLAAKQVIADTVDRAAERVMLDFTRDAVTVRLDIDGVWHNVESREREEGDGLLVALKKICNLNPNERRARQEGKFKFTYQEKKYGADLLSQGTQTGERVIVKLDKGTKGLETLEELGMREKMRGQLKEMLGFEAGGGLVLVSAMPSGGMSTLWAAVMRSTDRMLRDFISIEDVKHQGHYVENIEILKFDAAAGESPSKVLTKAMLKQPDVYLFPELPDAETMKILCNEVNQQGKLAIIGVRAKESVEAILRVLLVKAPPEDVAQALKAVVNVRLVRKLPETCKQAYEPPPQLLQKLGLPPGRIRHLYREWQPPPEEEKRRKPPPGACETCGLVGPSCHGLGYLGRTGIFELLTVEDSLREALVKQPKLEVLRQIAKKSGHRGLQEEGILLVAQGTTSLTELQRVLKQ
jgi:type II secretory ATPase GspE/PulE/Tfp pilus assembly ATPase PilB-like protein